jgi:hypothetical protein
MISKILITLLLLSVCCWFFPTIALSTPIEDPWIDVFGLKVGYLHDGDVRIEGGIRTIPDSEGYYHYWSNWDNSVDWGDGDIDQISGHAGYLWLTHTYLASGKYSVIVIAEADCRRDHSSKSITSDYFYNITDSETIKIAITLPSGGGGGGGGGIPDGPLPSTLLLFFSGIGSLIAWRQISMLKRK